VLDSPRNQLSRTASRLTQTAGLVSLDLASEVVASAYGAIGAAVEVALREATQELLDQLRGVAPHTLSPPQVAASAESVFTAFMDAERARGRFDVDRALKLRAELVRSVRSSSQPPRAPSVIIASGVPGRDHFRAFFELATGGVDPRGTGATPPLPRLIGRVDQIRGPRNDFAHECADPSKHELVVGQSQDHAGLAGRVAELQTVIVELGELLDVLELACGSLRHVVAGHSRTTAPGHRPWWQNWLRKGRLWMRDKA
jgi:hypothetical protein